MNDAIRLVLRAAGWRAGGRRVAFQACDDSDAATGLWSEAICRANALAYAADPNVLGVVGTYNSGCAKVMIPLLGSAPGGGLAMVSPGNTLVCLTQPSPGCTGGEPSSLYPRRRNYARVVPNDAYQGAGLALFAMRERIRSVYVLYAGADAQALGAARTFRGAARALGVKVVGFSPWDVSASSYVGLMRQVARTSANGVLLAGLTEENGARLIKDKVAVLGATGGKVKLLAPDGFAQHGDLVLDHASAVLLGQARQQHAVRRRSRHLAHQPDVAGRAHVPGAEADDLNAELASGAAKCARRAEGLGVCACVENVDAPDPLPHGEQR